MQISVALTLNREPRQWSSVMEFIGQDISDGRTNGPIPDYPTSEVIGAWTLIRWYDTDTDF